MVVVQQSEERRDVGKTKQGIEERDIKLREGEGEERGRIFREKRSSYVSRR